jgi:cysteinyl-tRNA synthetase
MLLYNTLGRKKEEFVPVHPGKANMYVCGITAYDLCHIGHARSALVFDVLVRQLRHTGLEVRFVRNFTDVDDKIINRANKEGRDWREVAQTYITAFHEDMDRLGVLRADEEPRATDFIPQIQAICSTLVDSGKAYSTPSGDVYFRVRAYEPYGKLSGRSLDDLLSGARVAPGEEKEDPLDFALWKAAKPGEPFWESPWGKGRPGWHIECSAMSQPYLPLDIHGGGQDLIFPHHENEIAQSEAATGRPLARYWVHNGFVQINSEKMSKSLGNFFTIRDILDKFLPETLRYFLLSSHYRSPLDFSFEGLEEAEKALRRVYTARRQMAEELGKAKWSSAPVPPELAKELADLETGFGEALEDDLNTAAALGHLFGVVRLAGRLSEDKALRKSEGARVLWTRIVKDLEDWSMVLGVFGADPVEFLAALRDCRAARNGLDAALVAARLEARPQAREAKDFAASDRIRDELAGLGVEVKDTPAGQTWDVA